MSPDNVSEPQLAVADGAREALEIAFKHGIDGLRLRAFDSLARSRGIGLDVVLRAALRGDLREIVLLPSRSPQGGLPPPDRPPSCASSQAYGGRGSAVAAGAEVSAVDVDAPGPRPRDAATGAVDGLAAEAVSDF